jgi:O-antigen/teichoic acid export membrane protein
LLAGAVVVSSASSIGSAAAGLGHPRIATNVELANLAITVPLLLLLVPAFGALAAASISTLTCFVNFGLVVRATSRVTREPVSEFVMIGRADVAEVVRRAQAAASRQVAKRGRIYWREQE